jgi:hypothetical protein
MTRALQFGTLRFGTPESTRPDSQIPARPRVGSQSVGSALRTEASTADIWMPAVRPQPTWGTATPKSAVTVRIPTSTLSKSHLGLAQFATYGHACHSLTCTIPTSARAALPELLSETCTDSGSLTRGGGSVDNAAMPARPTRQTRDVHLSSLLVARPSLCLALERPPSERRTPLSQLPLPALPGQPRRPPQHLGPGANPRHPGP